jgi:DNA helicase-2/ATP-dependent DNA helicase PcrA
MLEILLETSPQGALIPAHIWTPWFSVLGSKSGFDSIEDCFRDLSEHVFAVETGLSSTPRMNRMVSKLDGYALVSNSDAHSAPNIGREANLFECEMGYAGIMDSLKARDSSRFLGTIEVFPEEGKYHYDGHRKCDVCLSPAKSRECGKICPQCGKGLTIGVLYRVLELADRPEGMPPENALPFKCLLSLESILSQIQGTKTAGVKVKKAYRRLIHKLGPELNILLDLPLDVIEKKGSEVLAGAVKKLRDENVKKRPGFDGRYGAIRLF